MSLRLRTGMMSLQEFEQWLPAPFVPAEPPLEAFDDELDIPKRVNGSKKPKTNGKGPSGGASAPVLKSKSKSNGKRARAGKKTCTKCGETRSLDDFRPHDSTADGFAAYCRFCQNELNKKYRDKNMPMRIKHHFATRVADQFGGKDNLPEGYTEALENYLGYSMATLAGALEARLKEEYEGKTLAQALKSGWHIDHIKPLSSFSPKEIGDDEFRACWSINNLRVISAADNRAKGARHV